MSGKSLNCSSAAGSIFLVSMYAWVLSKMADKLRMLLIRRGALAWYIEIVIKKGIVQRVELLSAYST